MVAPVRGGGKPAAAGRSLSFFISVGPPAEIGSKSGKGRRTPGAAVDFRHRLSFLLLLPPWRG